MFLNYQQVRECYRLKLTFLKQEMERYKEKDLMAYSVEWSGGLKEYMDDVKGLMLSGADQLTKAVCVTEGRRLVEVEYIGRKMAA